ncbi:MAG TPA: type II toxin-antitoxin system prevent-host-death family antitoxin [Stellaceae bacterium]|nr:type II toxin-antitoxin system prevent-host-death family antitoxin [Stellaceae bacterium]
MTDKAISAAEANRQFSRVLREVRQGSCYVVTAHGAPVAKIVPVTEGDAGRERARRSLLTRLRKQKARKVGRWSRDELYD